MAINTPSNVLRKQPTLIVDALHKMRTQKGKEIKKLASLMLYYATLINWLSHRAPPLGKISSL